MIPQGFEYFAPSSVQEAVSLGERYGGDAKFLSGGHSLLPMMKLRLAAPKYVIDLGSISELAQLSRDGDKLKIGALVTHHDIETSGEIRRSCPLLAQTAAEIGDPQVRNRGTIGGSLAHADPAADYPAALLALDAEVEIEGASGSKRVGAGDFFVGLMASALQEGELLVAVHVPVLGPDTGTAYAKLRQQASGFAIAGVAAVVTRDASGKCSRLAVGVTGVGPKPFRASQVETTLVGKKLNSRNVAAACRQVASGVEVLSDLSASAEYRSAMADVFVRRAIAAAAAVPEA
ncbi:MAG: xanthine dehydrogenase family protein subunit M [Acidobacteria bacterium]|nr:xanthine dehydrogenase family protein subunit M [Acidobacteriota bacterium]